MMILAYWFLLIAALMPYGLVQLARGKNFDNSKPRDTYANAEGLQKRAYNAHLNSLEVFPFYAVAVMVALLSGFEGWILNVLAGGWILLRGAYIYAYLKDMPKPRSMVWAAGMLVCILIITMPLWAPYPELF
ncbi:MAG: hypothetical protein DI585_02115 [Pseudomonas fluorescens]|nr:MAG: hypothetical protein DI585_02115 [Pseudomonas fluorescens]